MQHHHSRSGRLSRMAAWSGVWTAKRLAWAGLFLLLAGAGAAPAADTSKDDCLACHGDKSLTTTHAGRTISRFVAGKKFASSVHGSLSCTNCHRSEEHTS